PARVALAALPEQIIDAKAPRHRGDDLLHQWRERQRVRPTVLRPRPWQCPYGHVVVELGPVHAADLLAPARGAYEQPDNPSVIVIVYRVPERGQLLAAEHAVARHRARRGEGTDYRVALDQTHPHRPYEQTGQRPAKAARARRAARLRHVEHDLRDVL